MNAYGELSSMNNNKLLIYGFGGFGLEVLSYIKAELSVGKRDATNQRLTVAGIIDENGDRQRDVNQWLGDSATLFKDVDDLDSNEYSFVVAIGDPQTRHKCFQKCLSVGLRPLTVVHPTAVVDSSASIGDRSILGPFSLVAPNA